MHRADMSLKAALGILSDISILRNLRVLIVDDNATNCTSLKTTLRAFGCYTVTARSGMDGIDILRGAALKNEPFDVLLLDCHMPHLNGLDVARAIAGLGLSPKIIALAPRVDSKVALEPNIQAICVKPVRRGHMLVDLLCRVPANEAAVDDVENSLPLLAGVCVMIVEDNAANRKVASCFLQQAECRVLEAVNGIEALDKINDEVDLVLMVRLPRTERST